MKTANTRNMVSLSLQSIKTEGRKYPAIAVCAMIKGKCTAVCSIVPYLNGHNLPSLRELRGIVEGRSIVAASKWTEVDGTAFDAIGFAVTSANCAFDEGGDLLAEVNAHRENVIDTLRENDRSHLQAKALAAFDAQIAKLAPALYAVQGVAVERDSTAGDNGALVDVSRVLVDGGVIGHVFAAPHRGRVEFKAQALGGELVAWNSDFTGAVRALAAHARYQSAAAKVGPKEEATDLGGNDPLRKARHAVDCALENTPGDDVGAVLTIDYPGVEQGFMFVMHGPKNAEGVRPVHTLAASSTSVQRLMQHWAGFVDNLRAAMTNNQPKEQDMIKAIYSVSVVARRTVQAHSGPKQVEVCRLTINHTDDSDKAEELRSAAQHSIHAWTPDSHDESYTHDVMSMVAALNPGAGLEWAVVVTFN